MAPLREGGRGEGDGREWTGETGTEADVIRDESFFLSKAEGVGVVDKEEGKSKDR